MELRELLKTGLIFLDGGMGTMLQAAGLAAGEKPERLNLSASERISEIHRAYFDAGANVVNTNTFGANPLKFGPDELREIVFAAVQNARAAAARSAAPQPKFVALDLGPTGRMLQPYGDLPFEDAVSAFAETVRLGAEAGVDLIFIETMNDLYETKAALLAAKENADLPVFVSNAYGADGKLLTGASPAAAVALLESMGADAIGVNCSVGPAALKPVAEEYLRLASVPVLVKPNAGLPKEQNGKTVYDVSPDEFAAVMHGMVADGVRLVGGCCGTTPAYISALHEAVAGLQPAAPVPKTETVACSYAAAVCFDRRPVLIGERINPTGKKRFQQALREHDVAYILNEAVEEQEDGAEILDVNVGVPGVDEPALLTETVQALQTVTELPLQIDTSDPAAMERALRVYNGKAVVNSVNGKAEVMRTVFPLIRKYGGVVVALTLDENGIPETAAGRLAIALKILETAQAYGVPKKDILFDPLCMAVSAAPDAAAVTLESIRLIRETTGCKTVLGVSNVSFGLPERGKLNAAFFTLAMENGLSAAIMNPHSAEMITAYRTYLALKGLDPGFTGYLSYAASEKGTDTNAAQPQTLTLKTAVSKGMKTRAAELARAMLETQDGAELIDGEIIPALNEAGEAFERKTLFLPQLLACAEAAAAAFEVIRAQTARIAAVERCAVVLCTVKGDIHDIGKNIVKLLLQNYGFRVTDLGKDVTPEAAVQAVCDLHAPILGLSALMTTTVPAMRETIRLLRRRAPWCRCIVGGAVLTADYAREIGADHYAADAMESVKIASMLEDQFKKEN